MVVPGSSQGVPALYKYADSSHLKVMTTPWVLLLYCNNNVDSSCLIKQRHLKMIALIKPACPCILFRAGCRRWLLLLTQLNVIHFQTWIYEASFFFFFNWLLLAESMSACQRFHSHSRDTMFFLPPQITLWRSSPLRSCSFRSWRAAGPNPWCLSSMPTYLLWSSWSTVRYFIYFLTSKMYIKLHTEI